MRVTHTMKRICLPCIAALAVLFAWGMFSSVFGETFAQNPQVRPQPRPLLPKPNVIQGKNVGVYLEDADFGIQAPQFEYDTQRFLVDIRENNDCADRVKPKNVNPIQTLRYTETPKSALKKVPERKQPKKLTVSPTSFYKTRPAASQTPVERFEENLFEEEISFESLSNESLIPLTQSQRCSQQHSNGSIRQVSTSGSFFLNEPPETDSMDRNLNESNFSESYFSFSNPQSSNPQGVIRPQQVVIAEIPISIEVPKESEIPRSAKSAKSERSAPSEEIAFAELSYVSLAKDDIVQTSGLSSEPKSKQEMVVVASNSQSRESAVPLYVSRDGTNSHSKEKSSVPAPEPIQYTELYNAATAMKASKESLKSESKEPELPDLAPPKKETKGSPLAWSKGDFTITPYGYINLSAAWESKRTAAGDYCVYAQSPQLNPASDRSAFYVDPRSSRIGVKIDGPGFKSWHKSYTQAVFECDFQGKYEWRNRSDFLMRKAYVEMGDECTKFLFGQDWEIVAPLFPNIFNYPAGSGVGNLGYRRAMARVDRKIHLGRDSSTLLQFAVCDNTVRDSLINGSLGASGLPVFQGRASYKFGEKTFSHRLPITVGVSGQYGVQKADYRTDPVVYGKSHTTWVVCLDFDVPITKNLRFQAELYDGENLSNLEGGIIQGVDSVLRDTIRCRGGWFTFGYQWTQKMRTNVGFAIEDPYNQDLRGTSEVAGGYAARTYSHSIFGNVMYNWSEAFMTGIELSQWKTNWQKYDPQAGTISYLKPGEPFRIECVARYMF